VEKNIAITNKDFGRSSFDTDLPIKSDKAKTKSAKEASRTVCRAAHRVSQPAAEVAIELTKAAIDTAKQAGFWRTNEEWQTGLGKKCVFQWPTKKRS
jgi:hypothetical protein